MYYFRRSEGYHDSMALRISGNGLGFRRDINLSVSVSIGRGASKGHYQDST